MKTFPGAFICTLILAGIIVSTPGNPACAADIPPSKTPIAKKSPEEPKRDIPATSAKDAAGQEQIAKLIGQLGDKDYYVRQRAQNELSRLGFEAFDALTAATTHEDLEIASRAKYLLRLMRVEWTAKNDPEDVKKLLKDYEIQPEETRLAVMRDLAVKFEGKGIPALCRLIRFEKSDVLSKRAVIELLQSPYGAEPPKDPMAETIRKLFEKSSRTSALWMLAWLRLADDPRAVAQWNKLVEAESALMRHTPGETSREILSGLIRYQIARLKKLGQTQEAMAAVRRLLDLEKGDLQTLVELLDWLLEQKAWKPIDELAARFKPRFDTEPILLYLLAQAQKEQGDDQKAEDTAKRAFQLNVGREEVKLLNRYFIAQRLTQRGLFDWAKREFEYVIAQAGANDITSIRAQWELSVLFHDQGQDQAAAKVLEVMLSKTNSKSNTLLAGRIASTLQWMYLFPKKSSDNKIVDRTLSEVRARMYFLQACHWERAGDQVKRRECLEKALGEEPGDVDVLIACYHLPDQTPEYQKKIMGLIRQTAEDIRVEIAAEPDNASLYNQLAWLIGNTEGDFDEALKCSQKSLELSPDNGGLYDTMARVYYAKGDYENALKHQQKAAELEPHSGLIAKQLELFKKARDEHKK